MQRDKGSSGEVGGGIDLVWLRSRTSPSFPGRKGRGRWICVRLALWGIVWAFLMRLFLEDGRSLGEKVL